MERDRDRLFFGLIAVVAGLIGLLQYFEVIGPTSGPLWALIFMIFGGTFVAFFARRREHWWAIIPGVVLFTVGLVIGADVVGLAWLGGPLMLAGIGAAFVGVLIVRPGFWWALIPAGTMFSLAALVYVDENLGWAHPEALLFIGLGVTFGLLRLLRFGERPMVWPLIPSAALILFGLVLAMGMPELLNLLWPVALIGGGIYLALRGRGSGSPPVSHQH
jgi:hypothetical protein